MPVYDYECKKCQSEKIDYFKKMEEVDPVCCEQPMFKRMGSPAVQLLGGGWAGSAQCTKTGGLD